MQADGQAGATRALLTGGVTGIAVSAHRDPRRANDGGASGGGAGRLLGLFSAAGAMWLAFATLVPTRAQAQTDTTPPGLVTTGSSAPYVSADGDSVTITFNEALDTTAAHLPSRRSFQISIYGAANPGVFLMPGTITVESPTRLKLTDFLSPIYQGHRVKISYLDPTDGNDTAALQDAAGNDVPDIAYAMVDNSANTRTPLPIMRHLSARPATPNSILVHSVLQMTSAGVDSYELQYAASAGAPGDSDWIDATQGMVSTRGYCGTCSLHTLSGLTPNTTYWARVRGTNSSGDSEWSQAVRTRTKSAGSIPVSDLRVSAPADSAGVLNLEWDYATSKGTVEGFDVRYRRTGRHGWNDRRVDAAERSLVLEHLDSDTVFQVQVRPRFVGNHGGKWSGATVRTGNHGTVSVPVVSLAFREGGDTLTEGDSARYKVIIDLPHSRYWTNQWDGVSTSVSYDWGSPARSGISLPTPSRVPAYRRVLTERHDTRWVMDWGVFVPDGAAESGPLTIALDRLVVFRKGTSALAELVDAGTPSSLCFNIRDRQTKQVLHPCPAVPTVSPFELSVADAQATEGTDATLDFVVTLDPEATATVTVDYATSDGTAREGDDYTAREGTLTFLPGERTKTVSVPIIDDSEEDNGETLTLTLSNAVGARLADAEATGTIHNTESEEPATLTADFRDLPESHGGEAFTVELRFSENFPVSYKTLGGYKEEKESVISVTNGRVTGARRLDSPRNVRWEITVEPDGMQDVSILLPATTDCAADGAICTEDDRPLSLEVVADVPGAPPLNDTNARDEETIPEEQAPDAVSPGDLTVSFETEPPDTHDGISPFTFRLAFSETLANSYSYKTMRDTSLDIRQGRRIRATNASRLEPPSNRRWEITVTPDGYGDITVGLGPTSECSEDGAMCSEGGMALANSITKVIRGPAALSVADATVEEAEGATVDFVVTLSKASTGTVTVDYATSNNTAHAGFDYRAVSDTLTFAPGDTQKTVSVPVIEDKIDEDSETFTLTLSGASGASIEDATATGTITNSDPMPQAWLARFGRTVAGQAVDAIGGRLEGGGGTHLRLGGVSFGTAGPRFGPEGAEGAHMPLAPSAPREESRAVTRRELLLRSSFRFDGDDAGGMPAWGAWGQAATGGFEGEMDGVRTEGTVTSGFLGADVGGARWRAGLALGLSEGEGSFETVDGNGGRAANATGSVESSLSAVYPYLRLRLGKGVDAWGLAGYGRGELTLIQRMGGQPDDGSGAVQGTYKTGIAMHMGALGIRGEVVPPSESGGFSVALKSDAFWVQTKSDAVRRSDGNLEAATGVASRLRLVVDASRSFAMAYESALTPSMEIGVRHDGGDAETGAGVEAGGGLRYTVAGATVEVSARTLIAHEQGGLKEWGASAILRIDPNSSGRGLSVALGSSAGTASGGSGRLWSLAQAPGLAQGDSIKPGGGFEAELGYGFGLPGSTGVLTPYAGLSLNPDGGHNLRTGARWRIAPDVTLSLDGMREQGDGDTGPVSTLMLRGEVRQ